MELVKKNLQILQKKSDAVNQMTFDEDFNVPDVKPDIYRMIQKKGEIVMEDVQVTEGKAKIQGWLQFQLLYVADTPQHQVASFEGKLELNESLNLKGIEPGDKVGVKWKIEDLSIHVIHSRKINVKAMVEVSATVDEIVQLALPIKWSGQSDVSERHQKVQMTSLGVHKKDTLRKKEEIRLPNNMPNIHQVLWSDLELRSVDVRADEGKISLKGELFLFLLYSEADGNPLQWMERVVPFSGELACSGCKSNMIPYVDVAIQQSNFEIKPDEDGEERLLQVEWIVEVEMKIYQEVEVMLLTDVYSPQKECLIQRKEQVFEQLLIKNDAKCRIHDQIPVKEAQGKILQICHSEGTVNVDQVNMVDHGIQVDGILALRILYCISDDEMPFYSVETAMPFSRVIEAEGVGADCVYMLQAKVDQLLTSMQDSSEIDVKAILNLDVLVLRQWKESMITEISEQELDWEAIEQMPGIVCYIVQPKDTLWDIAKKFHTTMEAIRQWNELEGDEPEPLQTLLIVKKTNEVDF